MMALGSGVATGENQRKILYIKNHVFEGLLLNSQKFSALRAVMYTKVV